MERDKQIEFLYSAISDVQELIQYTESKAGFVIGILTAYIAVVFVTLENIVKYSADWTNLFWTLYIILIALICLSIWIVARIIIPIKNPSQCMEITKDQIPEIEFYLAPNSYESFLFPFFNLNKFKLKRNFNSYLKDITKIDEKDILKVLTIELFKISFIRNLKSDRLKILIYSIFLTSLFLVLFYIRYQIELNGILIAKK